MVTRANQSYINSFINTHLNLVHTAQVTYTETGDDLGLDIDRLQNPSDGYMGEVHQWRNDYGADIVSLFVGSGNYDSIAFLMITVEASFESKAFSVVVAGAASDVRFTHELGHNMGCDA